MTRAKWVEAGARAWMARSADQSNAAWQNARLRAAIFIGGAEQLIRADEAARHHDGGDCECVSAYTVEEFKNAIRSVLEEEDVAGGAEPLIRADERERMAGLSDAAYLYPALEKSRQALADLRDEVEVARDNAQQQTIGDPETSLLAQGRVRAYNNVLSLIDKAVKP